MQNESKEGCNVQRVACAGASCCLTQRARVQRLSVAPAGGGRCGGSHATWNTETESAGTRSRTARLADEMFLLALSSSLFGSLVARRSLVKEHHHAC